MDGLDGYQPGDWGGDCGADGSITLVPGEVATCTLTNDDISPTLTVTNTVINDNGGTVTDEDAFVLRVGSDVVSNGVGNAFDAGTYTVSQVGLPGYLQSTWGGDCSPDGTITLTLGQDASCTVTNNDISPTITVVKTIINNNGGTVIDEDVFGLKVDDSTVLHDVANEFDVGSHTVSEDGLAGYLIAVFVCYHSEADQLMVVELPLFEIGDLRGAHVNQLIA